MIKKSGRLFTFGCSFTNYFWPTWADFIGGTFSHYENWGRGGAGNYYITSMVYECNEINKFTSDDTVIVMFSSSDRFDYINENEIDFVTRGGVYAESNIPIFGEHFLQNIWSNEFGLYNSWLMMLSTIELLKNTKCKYKIISAFDLSLGEGAQFNLNFTKRIKKCYEKITEIMKEKSLRNFVQNNYKETQLYTFYDYRDGHPTITMHHDYIKSILPEFYNDNMEIMRRDWENYLIDFIGKDKTRMNFMEYKGLEIKNFSIK